jgi:hypothetical protein
VGSGSCLQAVGTKYGLIGRDGEPDPEPIDADVNRKCPLFASPSRTVCKPLQREESIKVRQPRTMPQRRQPGLQMVDLIVIAGVIGLIMTSGMQPAGSDYVSESTNIMQDRGKRFNAIQREAEER